MKKDTIIFKYIKEENERQIKGIELIASENYFTTGPFVRLTAAGADIGDLVVTKT